LIWLAPNRGEKERTYEGFLDRERALLRALFAAGAAVYAGTDTLMPFVVPGAALKEEVRNFAELGLTPEQALVTATSAPGRFWAERQRRNNVRPIELGRIEVGLPADVVLYREDPTRSLDALDSIETVIADGRVYPRALLDAWLEEVRAHFHGGLYAGVMSSIAAFLADRYNPEEVHDP
jgi:imidazolonepropionase-like amidohydrolase